MRRQIAVLLALGLLLLSGCSLVGGAEPTPTIVPIMGLAPDTGCIADEVLAVLKPLVPYTQASVSHSTLLDVHNLTVWFVDPDLDPLASGERIAEEADQALWHAARLAQRLLAADDCVPILFEGITAIVVDRDYNQWFMGQILTSSVSGSFDPTDEEIEQARQAFTQSYVRSEPTGSADRMAAPADSCSWVQVRARLQSHFDPARQNVAFYFVVDDDGVGVWTQWDSQAELEAFLADLMSIRSELFCLYPRLDTLWVIEVDSLGVAEYVFAAPGEAVRDPSDEAFIDQLEMIYPPQQLNPAP